MTDCVPDRKPASARSADDELRRLTRLYAMLSRINRAIVRADDPYELYENACRIAVEDGGYLFASIGLIEPGNARLSPVARAGAPIDPERLAAPDAPGGQAKAKVLRDGVTHAVVDVAAVGEVDDDWSRALREVGARAVAWLPLSNEEGVIGTLAVATARCRCDAAEIELLTEVADDISFALRMMRREEKRIAAETKIQYLAYYDGETGLPGRTLFAERLNRAAGERSVLAINIRRYHAVLQAIGQAAGVHLARGVAARLESLLPTAEIARLSPAEFGCQIDAGNGVQAVEETAWQVHRGLTEPLLVDGHEVFLDPFVGIAAHAQGGDAAATIDAALFAAGTGTQDSTDCCRFFVPGMDGGSRQVLDLDTALRRALARGEFTLHFQPQVSLTTGRIVGAEALIRWQRPGHGLVPPAAFIPFLETTGLIIPVGEWVLAEACARAASWQAQGLQPFRVAVNFAASQFQGGDVGELVRRTLATTGLDAQWLELEVTESAILVNAEAVIRTLNELKAQGVSQSLDDFGTGYSSLSYLQRLPVSRIKVDQSFVAHVTTDAQSAAIVRAVVGMAHNLKLEVIAEGVESDGQLAFLRGLGCDEIQGYYFSRPLPADEFAALLHEDRRLSAPAARAGEPVLLVVDDEPHVLSALRRSLRRSEFRILTASSAPEAFELLATHPVGVVLSDQRMANMTGTEFLRRVREIHPEVVRVILSGYTDLSSVIDAVNRGAIYKFITKPWDDAALIESIRDAFRLHDIERENRELSRRLSLLESAGA